jgi:predicted kinase
MKIEPTVIILVGAPGSGKSTLSKEYEAKYNAVICSADHFFTDERGVYNWNPEKIGVAHNVCKNKFQFALQHGQNSVIDNTNTKWRDMKHYVLGAAYYGYNLIIAETRTAWRNDAAECAKRCIHNVPQDKIQQMITSIERLYDSLDNHLRQIFEIVHYNHSEGTYTCH